MPDTTELLPICPECTAGKCHNCNGEAWDFTRDQLTTCRCDSPMTHQARS